MKKHVNWNIICKREQKCCKSLSIPMFMFMDLLTPQWLMHCKAPLDSLGQFETQSIKHIG